MATTSRRRRKHATAEAISQIVARSCGMGRFFFRLWSNGQVLVADTVNVYVHTASCGIADTTKMQPVGDTSPVTPPAFDTTKALPSCGFSPDTTLHLKPCGSADL